MFHFCCDYLTEAVELLHNTNIQSLRTSLYDSNNYKKSLVVLNGGANSNLSLIDDKVVVQSGNDQIFSVLFISYLLLVSNNLFCS